ncbi:uncharacterized protein AB675_5670 [Cyphellophora attinorum]|uniref:Clr5 domain-containing protein n=1 Tax=Cyphellophora attinorum TaxID=1664694 RepID=A0A0N1HCZ4_9EURO|nr:uncharacterized protein AB675_5670 [Phialophora attinorum]KPI41962.1 hypothetical protein AB675_5670 [Phialophora attinorum]
MPATPLRSQVVLGGPMTKDELLLLSPDHEQTLWGAYADIGNDDSTVDDPALEVYVGSGIGIRGVKTRTQNYVRISEGQTTPESGKHEQLLAKPGIRSRPQLIAGYRNGKVVPRPYVLLMEQLCSILTKAIDLPLGRYLSQSYHEMLLEARHESLPDVPWVGLNRAAQLLQCLGSRVVKRFCDHCKWENDGIKYRNVDPGLPGSEIKITRPATSMSKAAKAATASTTGTTTSGTASKTSKATTASTTGTTTSGTVFKNSKATTASTTGTTTSGTASTPGTSSDNDLDIVMSDTLPLKPRRPHKPRQPYKPQRGSPSHEDWARIRPILAELYVDQGMRLQDVQDTLVSQHNFHATTDMYRKRITQWKLQKCVKSADKASGGYD